MTDENDAPGWRAIDAALARVHGGQEPRHYAAAPPAGLGGGNVIQGISAYSAEDPPHWHFVTYGLTELYAKESDDAAVSGYGFELTLRVARHGEGEPPAWGANLLHNLGRYVATTGNRFAPGHYMDLNGPISLDDDTAIRAIVVREDDDLPLVMTPHGTVQFLQVVGITLDELRAIKRWNAGGFGELLVRHVPKGVTDLRRASLLVDPEVAAQAEAGALTSGSSTSALYVSLLCWTSVDGVLHVDLGTSGVRDLAVVLPARIRHGRSLALASQDHLLVFEAAEVPSVAFESGREVPVCRVRVTPAAADELGGLLLPEPGETSAPSLPGVRFRIVSSA